VYHIESVMHFGEITPDGYKHFRTTLSLSNGMPIDQSDATLDFPRYPGFTNISSTDVKEVDVTTTLEQPDTFQGIKIADESSDVTTITKEIQTGTDTTTQGDDSIATSLDPGTSGDH